MDITTFGYLNKFVIDTTSIGAASLPMLMQNFNVRIQINLSAHDFEQIFYFFVANYFLGLGRLSLQCTLSTTRWQQK